MFTLTIECNPSMESQQNLSSFSSLQQLLEVLENLIALESSRKSNPWISITRLGEVFLEKYELSLEDVAQAHSYNDNLRSLFASSKCFSIYGTPIPQEFYVALRRVVVPGYDQNQTRSIQSEQPQRVSEYQPILVSEIKSVDDLEIVLVEMIRSLTINHPKQFATFAALSKKFHEHYEQPIRTVMRRVCPDMKLIDLLKTTPNLCVQEVDKDWQITLEVDSLEFG